jgi:hypothetical protein
MPDSVSILPSAVSTTEMLPLVANFGLIRLKSGLVKCLLFLF